MTAKNKTTSTCVKKLNTKVDIYLLYINIRVISNMEYRGAHRMGASIQHVKQQLLIR